VTLQAHLRVGFVFNITTSGFPTTWMGIIPGAAVMATNTDITLCMAGLARLQVPASFSSVFTCAKFVRLPIGSDHQVGLDVQVALGVATVAGVAE
jgi:hypothetical protein